MSYRNVLKVVGIILGVTISLAHHVVSVFIACMVYLYFIVSSIPFYVAQHNCMKIEIR